MTNDNEEPSAASAGSLMNRATIVSDEQVPMVGGPKDGETYRWTTARTLLIPGGKDMKQKVTADGVVTIFGEHTYEMNCWVRDGKKRS